MEEKKTSKFALYANTFDGEAAGFAETKLAGYICTNAVIKPAASLAGLPHPPISRPSVTRDCVQPGVHTAMCVPVLVIPRGQNSQVRSAFKSQHGGPQLALPSNYRVHTNYI